MQGWIDQLVHNTGALTADVGLAYGPVAARAFNQLWAQHTQFLVDYAVAVGSGDEEAQDEAAWRWRTTAATRRASGRQRQTGHSTRTQSRLSSTRTSPTWCR